jgi:hypothetical protein
MTTSAAKSNPVAQIPTIGGVGFVGAALTEPLAVAGLLVGVSAGSFSVTGSFTICAVPAVKPKVQVPVIVSPPGSVTVKLLTVIVPVPQGCPPAGGVAVLSMWPIAVVSLQFAGNSPSSDVIVQESLGPGLSTV